MYAFFGTSLQLLTGPTAVMSVLTSAAMPTQWNGAPLVAGTDAYVQLAAMLAFTVGVIQLVLHYARAGFLTRLISEPVMLGFVSGSALLTASTQFGNLLGVRKCVGTLGGSCTFAAAIGNIVSERDTIGWAPPVGSLLCIALLVGWKYGLARLLPRRLQFVRFGAPIALVCASIAVMWTHHAQLTALGIKVGDTVPPGLPSPRDPFPHSIGASDIGALLLAAIPPALIGYMESLTIAQAVARQTGPYEIDASQELFAVGVCNLAVALGQGYPVTGSFSRTAVMASSGARSPLASMLAGLLIIPILLVAAPALSELPKIATASIVLVYIGRLIQLPEWVRLWRTDVLDFIVFAITFCVVIFVDIGPAFMAGIMAQWFIGLVRAYATKTCVRVLQWIPPPVAAPAFGASQLESLAGSATLSAAGASSDPRGSSLTTLASIAAAAATGTASASSATATGGLPLPRGLLFAAALPRFYPHVSAALLRGLQLVEVASPADMIRAGLVRSDSALGGGAGTHSSSHRALGRACDPGAHAEQAAAHCEGGILVLRFEPDIQFHNATRLLTHAKEALSCYGAAASALVLDLSHVNTVDSTGVHAIFSLADVILATYGVPVAAAGGSDNVRTAMLRAAHAHHSLVPSVAVDEEGAVDASAIAEPPPPPPVDFQPALALAFPHHEASAAADDGMNADGAAHAIEANITKAMYFTLAGRLKLFDGMHDALAWAADHAADAVLQRLARQAHRCCDATAVSVRIQASEETQSAAVRNEAEAPSAGDGQRSAALPDDDQSSPDEAAVQDRCGACSRQTARGPRAGDGTQERPQRIRLESVPTSAVTARMLLTRRMREPLVALSATAKESHDGLNVPPVVPAGFELRARGARAEPRDGLELGFLPRPARELVLGGVRAWRAVASFSAAAAAAARGGWEYLGETRPFLQIG